MFYITCVIDAFVSYKSSNRNDHNGCESLSSGLPVFSSTVGYVVISLEPNSHLIILQNGSTIQISYRNKPRFEMSN